MLNLRYRLLARVADEYAAEGFTAVAQDNIYGDHVRLWLDMVETRPVHLVVLRPSVDVVAQRHEERRLRSGKVAYRGGYTPHHNDLDIATIPRDLGLWLDTSAQTPGETVDEIITRASDAAI